MVEQQIDSTTPTGHVLAANNEFQRKLIVEGTHKGLAAARARGKVPRAARPRPSAALLKRATVLV